MNTGAETDKIAASAAAVLRLRLLQTSTEADLQAMFVKPVVSRKGVLPVYVWAGLEPAGVPARRCSCGCHTLPASARFDPHTGVALDAYGESARVADRARQMGRRLKAFLRQPRRLAHPRPMQLLDPA
jgi:hypothetical protein